MPDSRSKNDEWYASGRPGNNGGDCKQLRRVSFDLPIKRPNGSKISRVRLTQISEVVRVREHDTVRVERRPKCLMHTPEDETVQIEAYEKLLPPNWLEPRMKLKQDRFLLHDVDVSLKGSVVRRVVFLDKYPVCDDDTGSLLRKAIHLKSIQNSVRGPNYAITKNAYSKYFGCLASFERVAPSTSYS